MFVGYTSLMNILRPGGRGHVSLYVHRLADEAIRPEGHGHVSSYIHRLTDEAIGLIYALVNR
jgi:hypothetical protein